MVHVMIAALLLICFTISIAFGLWLIHMFILWIIHGRPNRFDLMEDDIAPTPNFVPNEPEGTTPPDFLLGREL
jgi:hypothetical protein